MNPSSAESFISFSGVCGSEEEKVKEGGETEEEGVEGPGEAGKEGDGEEEGEDGGEVVGQEGMCGEGGGEKVGGLFGEE